MMGSVGPYYWPNCIRVCVLVCVQVRMCSVTAWPEPCTVACCAPPPCSTRSSTSTSWVWRKSSNTGRKVLDFSPFKKSVNCWAPRRRTNSWKMRFYLDSVVSLWQTSILKSSHRHTASVVVWFLQCWSYFLCLLHDMYGKYWWLK